MVRAERLVEISDSADLLKVVEEVEASGEAVRLERDGKVVARIVPMGPKRSRKRAIPSLENDPLWKLVGKFASNEPTDVGKYKHAYLAQAYEKAVSNEGR